MYNAFPHNTVNYNTSFDFPVDEAFGAVVGAGIVVLAILDEELVSLIALGVGGAILQMYSPASQAVSRAGWIDKNPNPTDKWVETALAAQLWVNKYPNGTNGWTPTGDPETLPWHEPDNVSNVGWD